MTSVNNSLELREAHGFTASRSSQSSRRTVSSEPRTGRLGNLKSYLTKLNDHIDFNDELCALKGLTLDQFKIKHSELRYLSLASDKSELQVEKFMNHHCGDGCMSIGVYLVRSGYWVTQTHIDFNNVKEVYKQFKVLIYKPHHPLIIEDNKHGGPSSSPSPMSEMD